MRTCTRCQASKPESDYRQRGDGTLRGMCRDCECLLDRQRRARRKGEYQATKVDITDWDTGPAAAKYEDGDPPKVRTIADDLRDRASKVETASLRVRLKEALDQLEQTRFELTTAIAANDARLHVDPIVARESSGVLREATVVALASDWHIESTVEYEQVNGVNEYNLEIARARVERFFGGFRYLTQYHSDHFAIRDGLLWLGGDLITGFLHADNVETNSLSPVQAIATLHGWVAAGIRSILAGTDLATLRVVCSSGNHGRLTEKMRSASREANSIEWLLYHSLAREFADEPRVKFTLPAGSQTYVQVYNKTIRFTHGDTVKYGGGVGGITIPIYKALARWQTVRHADLTCMGHFHSYHDLPDLVVNGSLIGYDAYAIDIGARFEQPRQAFFLLDTKRGKTMPADIWVTDSEEAA